MMTRLRLWPIAFVAAALSARTAWAVQAGAGVSLSNGSLATSSNTTNFLASASEVTCSSSTGKLIVDTTAGTLSWCNSSTIGRSALGDDSGNATALKATSTDGSNGLTVSDNASQPAAPPSANQTLLHTMSGNLYLLPTSGATPGTPVLPSAKVLTTNSSLITAQATTGLSGLAIEASKTHIFEALLEIDLSAATADPIFYLVATGSTTDCVVRVNVQCVIRASTTSIASDSITSFGGSGYTCTTGSANDIIATLNGSIRGCAGDITVDIQLASNGGVGTTDTVLAGSWARVQQLP